MENRRGLIAWKGEKQTKTTSKIKKAISNHLLRQVRTISRRTIQ